MRGPDNHVVFSPKKNFQELQLHQTPIFFSEFWHMSRSKYSQQKGVRDFQKDFWFQFYLCFSFFSKMCYD